VDRLIITGVGSRKTPMDVCKHIREIAAYIGSKNGIIRSGNARGADHAFEHPDVNCEIYMAKQPNYGTFANPKHTYYFGVSHEAKMMALKYHPTPHIIQNNNYIWTLMARNSYQVLGHDLKSPTNGLICWTPDGATSVTTRKTGGTGQAIRIANDMDIPVYNIQKYGTENVKDFVDSCVEKRKFNYDHSNDLH